MKEVLSWLVRWARRAGTRDFYPVLAALVSPVKNIFSPPYSISVYVSPLPSNLGRQSCRAPCLGLPAAYVALRADMTTDVIASFIPQSGTKNTAPQKIRKQKQNKPFKVEKSLLFQVL
jgi:hypothetical protein